MVTRKSAKAKGAEAERLVAESYRENGNTHADRRQSNGRNDRGDIGGVDDVCTEVKAESSYGGKLAEWLAEADVEARNAGVPIPIVWHKRRGTTKPEEWYVTMWGGTWLKLQKRMQAQPFDWL